MVGVTYQPSWICTPVGLSGIPFLKKMATKLIIKTLESAVQNRTITEDLIIHSDLGTQYTSDEYNKRLNELHIRHSYIRKGCPYDNAPMESFHASLKKECVYPIPVFEHYEAVASVLFEYVHSFYNRKRIHSSLSYQTPLQGFWCKVYSGRVHPVS
ncbi:integrase core domain-containing protein [Furfurilactobacillus cerevisiae]